MNNVKENDTQLTTHSQNYFNVLVVQIDVIFDAESDVYMATSKDIDGLVLEAETFKVLESEVQEAVINLTQFSKKIVAPHCQWLYA